MRTTEQTQAEAANSSTKPRSNRKAASTPGGGLSPAQTVRQNNRWRENYNPLRGLMLQKVVNLMEAGERGEFSDLQWLYRFIEKRFPVLRSLILRRRSALVKLDWDIKVPSELPKGATEAMAEEQRQFLRSRYEKIRNLKEAIKFLSLAEFRGFAILNKHRYHGGPDDGAVEELHWLPQWNFVRDGLFGEWYWNKEAASGANARSLGEANKITEGGESPDFIIRVVDMPVNEIAAVAFMRTGLGQKDHDAFIELFGLPGCVVIMPGNIPQGKEDEYRDAAESVAQGASGALPAGGDAKFPSSSIRSNAPFKEYLEWQEKDVVLAGTGGKLAMLTAPTGLNSSQGDVHEDAFDEIAIAEARELSEIFQQQFDKQELEVQFPGQPVLAYFELAAKDETDTAQLADNVVKMEGVGFQTDVDEISEKMGLTLTRPEPVEPNDPTLQPDPANEPVVANRANDRRANRKAANRDNGAPTAKYEAAAGEQLQAALEDDLAHVVSRLAEIYKITDDTIFTAKLQAFLRDFPQLKQNLLRDPATARAMYPVMAGAFANGLATPNKK